MKAHWQYIILYVGIQSQLSPVCFLVFLYFWFSTHISSFTWMATFTFFSECIVLFIPCYLSFRIVTTVLLHEGDTCWERDHTIEVIDHFFIPYRIESRSARKTCMKVSHFFYESYLKHLLDTRIYPLIQSSSITIIRGIETRRKEQCRCITDWGFWYTLRFKDFDRTDHGMMVIRMNPGSSKRIEWWEHAPEMMLSSFCDEYF